jgi:peptidoglycan/LPS O-acetylase OafA/YrhL
MAKTAGMAGILFAFITPVAIMLLYYPQKVAKEAALSKANNKEIIRESVLITLIISVCAVVATLFNFDVNWTVLIISGLLYSIAFGLLLFCLSNLFREESGKLLQSALLKLNRVKG